jgi:general secretion pathway protein A
MYNTYFGFREKPFKLVPNPDFLYLSKNHEIALAHLSYAVSQGDGFVVITGEVGTGKTTLCRIFLERLEEGIESAYIFNPRLDSVQLLTTICNEFGIRTNSNNLKQLLDVINGYLIMKSKAGRKVLLLIDEAQNLSVENLEMVRMLSNLETTRNKLLQIILVGQPELGEMLDSYKLRQLAQRISLSAHLTPLTVAETAGYIEHRLLIAAQRHLDLFSPRACRLIHNYSRGIPRKINIAADRALLTAYSINRPKVTASIAKIAIEELTSRAPAATKVSPKSRRYIVWAAVTCALLLVAAVVYFKSEVLWQRAASSTQANTGQTTTGDPPLRTYKIKNYTPIAPAIANNPSSGTFQSDENSAARIGTPSDMAEVVNTLEHEKSRLDAMRLIFEKWQQAPPSASQLPEMAIDPEYFEIAAHQYGLRMYTIESDWALVKQVNLPAIIAFRKQRSTELVYMAMVGWSSGQIRLAVHGKRLIQTDLETLLPHTHGTAYVYWKNSLGFDPVINANSPPKAILAVKKMLQQVGYDELNQTAGYDRATEKAILDFQLRYSLTPDGLVGSLTKIFLINEAERDINGVDRPRLYGISEGREGA